MPQIHIKKMLKSKLKSQKNNKKEAVSNAKFETASLGLTRGIGRFEVAKRPNGSEWR